VPNYNAADDIDMFKETVTVTLGQYAKNRQDDAYKDQIREYILLYECEAIPNSWIFIRQPTLISLEFTDNFFPSFYQKYLVEKSSYGEHFTSLESPLKEKTDEYSFNESPVLYDINEKLVKVWYSEMTDQKYKLVESATFRCEYEFVNELLYKTAIGETVLFIR
jgi:hypothetical protein